MHVKKSSFSNLPQSQPQQAAMANGSKVLCSY